MTCCFQECSPNKKKTFQNIHCFKSSKKKADSDDKNKFSYNIIIVRSRISYKGWNDRF